MIVTKKLKLGDLPFELDARSVSGTGRTLGPRTFVDVPVEFVDKWVRKDLSPEAVTYGCQLKYMYHTNWPGKGETWTLHNGNFWFAEVPVNQEVEASFWDGVGVPP